MAKTTKLKSGTALAPASFLADLAARITDDLARREKSKTEWIEATISLCQNLAAARTQFKDNISFGQWFEGTGIKLNKNDRAAAAAMGAELERAKLVLENTTRYSLRHIHKEDFCFPHVGKTTEVKKSVTIEAEVVSTPASKPYEPTDVDNMEGIVRAFRDGKPFTVRKARVKLGGLDLDRVRKLLQDMQDEAVGGFKATLLDGQDMTADAEWRLMFVVVGDGIAEDDETSARWAENAKAVTTSSPEPTPEPKIEPAKVVVMPAPKLEPQPIVSAVAGMLSLADVELRLGGVIANLDRLAKREGTPAIRAIADDIRDLLSAWRGDIPDTEVPAFLKKLH